MKTPRDYIRLITVNKSNLQHIANTGIINGSLLIGIENIMKEYAREVAREALNNAYFNSEVMLDPEDDWETCWIVERNSIITDKNIPEL